MKTEGKIIELDPGKKYIMFVKAGSILDKCVRHKNMKVKDGTILFVSNHDDYKFVENSSSEIDIVVEE